MRRLPTAALISGLIAAPGLGGCMKTSEKYCELHGAEDPAHCPGDAGSTACQTSDDCTATPATPACAPDSHVCVQCISSDTCANPLPACSPDHTCGRCTAHTDCPSLACLPDGTCASEASVAYAAAGGNGTACTRTMPCGTVDDARKRLLPYIKVAGTVMDSKLTSFDASVTILADPGARMIRMGDGSVVEVKSTAEVTIYDLEISNATGNGSSGITMGSGSPKLTLERVFLAHNRGYGINTTVGTVTMHRSVITDNKAGGALLTSTNFVLQNNLFIQNGDPAGTTGSQTGGLTLSAGPQTNVFEFNTVADNSSTPTTATVRGLNCTLPFDVSNNLFINNKTSGNCNVTHSMYETGVAVTNGNIAGDAMFRSVDASNVRSPDLYRIGATSAAKNAADPAATLADDIDGDARPQDGVRDIGADEYKP